MTESQPWILGLASIAPATSPRPVILAVDAFVKPSDLGADEIPRGGIGVAAVDFLYAPLLDGDIQGAGIRAIQRTSSWTVECPRTRTRVAPCPIMTGRPDGPGGHVHAEDLFFDVRALAGVDVDAGRSRVSLGPPAVLPTGESAPLRLAASTSSSESSDDFTGIDESDAIWPSPSTSPTRSFCSSDRSAQPPEGVTEQRRCQCYTVRAARRLSSMGRGRDHASYPD